MSLLFTVEETFASEAGVIVVGYAPNPETPLPKQGDFVDVYNPNGSTFRVEVIGVDVKLSTRTCFGQKTVNRAMLVDRGEGVEVLTGAEIRRID